MCYSISYKLKFSFAYFKVEVFYLFFTYTKSIELLFLHYMNKQFNKIIDVTDS